VKLRPGSGWFVDKAPLEAGSRALRGGLDLEELGMRMVRDRFVGETENHFSEADFIKRYDVTRGDLRKVLIKLSQDGMVERARGHGWRFLPMLDNLRAQQASYDFRIAVETASIMARTFEVDAARLRRSKDEHQRLVASALHANGRRLFEVNAGFHLMLAEFSRNEFFVQAVAHQNRLRRVIEYFIKVSSDRLKNSCREHLSIIEALEKGDQRWASLLLERHLSEARDRLGANPDINRKGKPQ
jgi:DNA-binding GntR family transcriptional regulator